MNHKYTFRILLCCIFIITASIPVLCKNKPSFTHLGIESGLAQNTVYCILQDKEGFMWFGTKDGLSRFDGYQFRNYHNDKNDKHSIGNNCIRSIFQGAKEDIWIGTDRGVYIYHPNTDCFEPFYKKTKQGVQIENEVNDIKQDQNGVYWFAVDWQGVFSYNPTNDELKSYDLNTIVNAWYIHIDSQNKVWIGTHGGGLNYLNNETQKFEQVRLSLDGKSNNLDDIYKIFQYNYDNLLIATANNGVIKLNQTSNTTEPFLPKHEYTPLFIRDIVRKSDHEIWFGTGDGIYKYDEFANSFTLLQHSQDPYSLSDNAVYSIYKDNEGGVWVGTYFGGVNYCPYQYTPFEKFYPIQDRVGIGMLGGKRVREFQLANNGNIWIGTEDGGLNMYNPTLDSFLNFKPDNTKGCISSFNIHGLLIDGDKLWVGTYNHGLDVMDLSTQKVIAHYNKTDKQNSICDNSIFSIHKDNSGRIWLGTLYGLCYYNPDSNDFTKIEELGNIFVNDITQTKDGTIWVGSLGNGLHQLNPITKTWESFKHTPNDSTCISNDKIISLFEDSRNTLWVATEGGGLCKYNKGKKNFTSFTTHERLPNNVIYKVVEDNHSNLWLSTNKGIACLNLDNFEVKQYTQSDGILSNQFNYKSGLKDTKGNIYFGGIEGFITFNPASFVSNKYFPPIYITQFKLFNDIIHSKKTDSPLEESIEFTKDITLQHNQSTFSFTFAALSYVAPEKNQYAYKLDGFDHDWIYTKGTPTAKYSNIPPGKYKFIVKATNNNGVWSDKMASINLLITPPYYKTIWAYLTYIILAIAITIYLLALYRNKLNEKHQRQQEIYESEKSKEVYNAKIEFFTNIAHEIRTPLSLIKGPLDCILGSDENEDEKREYLKAIELNTNRLIDLSNQLLDFRKTEEKGFQFNFVSTNIPQLISDIFLRFNSTAIKLGLKFDVELFSNNFYADIDIEALTKIISNLLSNALKHAKSEIKLSVIKSNDSLIFNVSSDGIKIKQHFAEKIFEPFYQVTDSDTQSISAGTGLGLPLSRSLAELHGGTLVYLPSDDKLNIFQLILPIIHTIKNTSSDKKDKTQQDITFQPNNSSQFSILIVEDDDELIIFLAKQLKKHYKVHKASNGDDAIKKLSNTSIDLIISDVIMPIMSGIQLCEELRSNISYSHIPIILLTAKSNLQSRIEGLDAGADAYIEKPFSMDYILAQTSNLLSNRKKIKEAFIRQPSTQIKSIALSKIDEEFLKQLTEVIDSNIADVQFNVDKLAESLNMSRSSLHRKVKGVSELTPNEFITLVRLKKAVKHLQEGYRVSEVYFIVGFSSSSYFSKVFKKQFGVSPRDWNGEQIVN